MPTRKFNNLLDKSRSDELDSLIKNSRILSRTTRETPSFFAVLTDAAQLTAGEENFSKELLMKAVKSDERLRLATQNEAFLDEFGGFLEAVVKKKLFKPKRTPTSPDDSDDETEGDEKDLSEINLEILARLDAIPIAAPGHIITDEHHNSLRSAVHAIAALLDDTENETILTFAPNFLPATFERGRGENDWKVIYNKAVTPSVQEMGGAGGSVKGAFFVRLPENARIASMIVRAKRLDERAAI